MEKAIGLGVDDQLLVTVVDNFLFGCRDAVDHERAFAKDVFDVFDALKRERLLRAVAEEIDLCSQIIVEIQNFGSDRKSCAAFCRAYGMGLGHQLRTIPRVLRLATTIGASFAESLGGLPGPEDFERFVGALRGYANEVAAIGLNLQEGREPVDESYTPGR